MPLSVYQAIFATFQKVAPLLKETAQMALMPQWKGVVGNIGFLSRGFSFFLHVSCKMKKQATGRTLVEIGPSVDGRPVLSLVHVFS